LRHSVHVYSSTLYNIKWCHLTTVSNPDFTFDEFQYANRTSTGRLVNKIERREDRGRSEEQPTLLVGDLIRTEA